MWLQNTCRSFWNIVLGISFKLAEKMSTFKSLGELQLLRTQVAILCITAQSESMIYLVLLKCF